MQLRRRQDGASTSSYWTTGATMVLEDAIRYALDERHVSSVGRTRRKDDRTGAVSDVVCRIEQSPHGGDTIHRDARETRVLPDRDLIR